MSLYYKMTSKIWTRKGNRWVKKSNSKTSSRKSPTSSAKRRRGSRASSPGSFHSKDFLSNSNSWSIFNKNRKTKKIKPRPSDAFYAKRNFKQ